MKNHSSSVEPIRRIRPEMHRKSAKTNTDAGATATSLVTNVIKKSPAKRAVTRMRRTKVRSYRIRKYMRAPRNPGKPRKPRKKKNQPDQPSLPSSPEDAKERFLTLLLCLHHRTILPDRDDQAENWQDGNCRDLSPLPSEIIQIIWWSFIQVCSRFIMIKHQSGRRRWDSVRGIRNRSVVTCLNESYWISFGLRHGPYRSRIPGSCQKKKELKILIKCGLGDQWSAQRAKMKKIIVRCHYRANVKHGPLVQRHSWRLPKRKKLAKKRMQFIHKSVKQFSFANGRKHGLFTHIIHFHDGSTFLLRKGTFDNGLKSGLWTTFLYLAQDQPQITDQDTCQVTESSLHPEGPHAFKDRGNYVAGKKHGEWTTTTLAKTRTSIVYYMEGIKVVKKIRDQQIEQLVLDTDLGLSPSF
jgi:hypothetical protein